MTLAIVGKLSEEFFIGPTDEKLLATHLRDTEKDKKKWNELLDKKLVEWGASGRLDDDEYVSPSKSILSICSQIAFALRDQGWPSPTDVVPDGEGGVVLYWDSGNESLRWAIEIDGSFDLSRFVNSKLVFRRTEE